MFFGYKTTTMVARFRPRVRVKKKRAINGGIRQHIKHIAHVTRIHRKVFDTRFSDLAQKHRNAIDVGFASDDANIRVLATLVHHMLAAAKTNFKPRGLTTKQGVQIQIITIRIHIPVD